MMGAETNNAFLQLSVSGEALFWRMPVTRRVLQQALEVMLAKAGIRPAALDLVLVRDGEMSVFNEQYMGSHGPTNILSFPLEEPEAEDDGCIHLGSLVLSVDTLHREALLYGQDPTQHCLRLFAHGLGHLQGLDHGVEMDELCTRMLEEVCAEV